MPKKTGKDFVKVILDTKVYPLEAIYGASYVFIDKVYIFLESAKKGKIMATFRSKAGTSAKMLKALAGEFMNELLNYALRVGLSKENKKIRQYLVEQALFAAAGVSQADSGVQSEKFSETGLGYSFEDDPLGIAIPWEEKYGQSRAKKGKNK